MKHIENSLLYLYVSVTYIQSTKKYKVASTLGNIQGMQALNNAFWGSLRYLEFMVS